MPRPGVAPAAAQCDVAGAWEESEVMRTILNANDSHFNMVTVHHCEGLVDPAAPSPGRAPDPL